MIKNLRLLTISHQLSIINHEPLPIVPGWGGGCQAGVGSSGAARSGSVGVVAGRPAPSAAPRPQDVRRGDATVALAARLLPPRVRGDAADAKGRLRSGVWGRAKRYSWGGCRPMLTQTARAETASGRLNRRASTVARPQGVMPTICVPSSLQAKCSCQRCCRGLNSGSILPVAGSMASVRSSLEPLHPAQARQRLSALVSPPLEPGAM